MVVEEWVGVGVDEVEQVDVDMDVEEPDCACLARFLAAAFVCQPHVHGLLTGEKKDPCRHFCIAAIAAKTSLLDGFWPLPLKTDRPSARSMS